jgi:hypothetical protein
MEKQKEIKVMTLKVSEIGTGFGNPRKISKKEKEKLKESLDAHGDFGLFLINENKDVIGGNQRLAILKETNPDTEVLCKMLVGYSDAELRAINIKDNMHNGEWDLDLLADWTADLNLDLGIKKDLEEGDVEERSINEMELIHYEKYDYVLIACRDELSYNSLIRTLGIEDKKVLIGPKKRAIKGRAIWYDDMKVNFVPKEGDEKNDL